jgi:hypothetical protein
VDLLSPLQFLSSIYSVISPSVLIYQSRCVRGPLVSLASVSACGDLNCSGNGWAVLAPAHDGWDFGSFRDALDAELPIRK